MADKSFESFDDIPQMTASDLTAYRELMKPQSTSDIVGKIGKADLSSASSRDDLVAYLGRSTLPLIPFGKFQDALVTISAAPAAHLNSSNRPTTDQRTQLKAGDPGLTLGKLVITPSKPTTLPNQILRVFFTIGNLYLKAPTDPLEQPANYLVVANPLDHSYWLVQNFYPSDENGIEYQNTKTPTFPPPKGKTQSINSFSLARIGNGSSVLGNATALLQLDPQMVFAFTADEMKVGGFVSTSDYQDAQASFSRGQPAGQAP